MREISRREFLLGAAVLATTSILPSCRQAGERASELPTTNPFERTGAPRLTNAPFLFGLHVDERAFARNLRQRETDVGRGVDVVLTFAKIGDPVRDDIRQLMEAGYEVALTLEYWDSKRSTSDPAFSLKEIAAGRYDADGERWFQFFKSLPRPIHLRPLHEGSSEWYPWGVLGGTNNLDDYVPAFQHVAEHARRVAGDKVRLQLCFNRLSRLTTESVHLPASAFYAGPSFVDEFTINGYNRPEYPEQKPFGQLMEPYYRELKALAPETPIWIGETASTEKHRNKAEWIVDMFATIKSTMPVSCLTWFDESITPPDQPIRDWTLDTSPRALAAFRAGITAR